MDSHNTHRFGLQKWGRPQHEPVAGQVEVTYAVTVDIDRDFDVEPYKPWGGAMQRSKKLLWGRVRASVHSLRNIPLTKFWEGLARVVGRGRDANAEQLLSALRQAYSLGKLSRWAAARGSGAGRATTDPRLQAAETIAVWWMTLLLSVTLLVYGVWDAAQGSGPHELRRFPRQAITHQVDVNQAELAELQLLPGIGPKLAERILESRRLEGAFRSTADLQRVSGIGPRTAARLQPHLRW